MVALPGEAHAAGAADPMQVDQSPPPAAAGDGGEASTTLPSPSPPHPLRRSIPLQWRPPSATEPSSCEPLRWRRPLHLPLHQMQWQRTPSLQHPPCPRPAPRAALAGWLTDLARSDSLRRLFILDVQTHVTKPKIVGWTKKVLSEAIKADTNHDGLFGKLKRFLISLMKRQDGDSRLMS